MVPEVRYARSGALASFSRLITFDKRGTGLSDRVELKGVPGEWRPYAVAGAV
jgi:hypothetical protein